MILLDTHVLIWADFAMPALGQSALGTIEQAGSSGSLAVSAIVFWEVGMLVSKGRVALPATLTVMQWRRALLETGLIELPLTGDIGIQATELESFHPDPADRMICATAMQTGALLVTADESILAWQGPLHTQDARA